MSTTFYTDPKYVTLLSTTALDGKPLEDIFSRLIGNDVYIASNFSNVIGIWQCNWYYDKNTRGYPKSHLCWLNTEEPTEFVKKNYDIIQEYTDLNSKIVNKLPDFDASNDEITAMYYSAMTGYTDPSIGILKPLEPIFDIGDYTKSPQLVISLKDNNKDLVTETSAWKRLFIDELDGIERIGSIVDLFLRSKLSTHLLDYHLSGQELQTLSALSNYLEEFNEKKSITSLSNFFYIDNLSDSQLKSGVDYVVHYVRKPYRLSGAVSEYQAIRQWRSGLIEHFGTISKEDPCFVLSGELTIPFDWKYLHVGDTKAYRSGGVSERLSGMLSVIETDDSQISPLDNVINATYTLDDYKISKRDYATPFADDSYSITLSPTYQTLDGIDEDFIEAKFGASGIDETWNSNFIGSSIDVAKKTKDRCVVSLANIRTTAPYVSYYAIGKGAR